MRLRILLMGVVFFSGFGCGGYKSVPVHLSVPQGVYKPEVHVWDDRGTRIVLKSIRPDNECLLYVNGLLAYNRLEYSGGVGTPRREEGLAVRFSEKQPSFYHHWEYLMDGQPPYNERRKIFQLHAVCFVREEFPLLLQGQTIEPVCVTQSAQYSLERIFQITEFIVGRGYANCIWERKR